MEEQEKQISGLTLERDNLEEKVKDLESELHRANAELETFRKQPVESQDLQIPIRAPSVTVDDDDDDDEGNDIQPEYSLLVPTPSGNHTTVVIDDEQLEKMKHDMLSQMRELNREEVARMIEQQDTLRWNGAKV